MLLPCGIDVFSGVEFVCCPMTKKGAFGYFFFHNTKWILTKCYVIEFIVSYREITNSRFSLTQSKLYISKFLGPIKVIKKDLNIS